MSETTATAAENLKRKSFKVLQKFEDPIRRKIFRSIGNYRFKYIITFKKGAFPTTYDPNQSWEGHSSPWSGTGYMPKVHSPIQNNALSI